MKITSQQQALLSKLKAGYTLEEKDDWAGQRFLLIEPTSSKLDYANKRMVCRLHNNGLLKKELNNNSECMYVLTETAIDFLRDK